jgi:hypothetical protein
MLELLVNRLGESGLDLTFRGAFEPGTEDLSRSNLIEKSALHDFEPLCIGGAWHITVRWQMYALLFTEALHLVDHLLSKSFARQHTGLSFESEKR